MFKMKKNFKSFCFITEPVTGTNSRQLLSGIDKIIRQLDQLKIDVQVDDPDISATKENTDTIVDTLEDIQVDVTTIKNKVNNQDTNVTNIYNLLDERLVKKLWITRADYNALVTKDPEVLYIVIESQSNS